MNDDLVNEELVNDEQLAIEDDGPVRVLTFQRPRQLNALTTELAAALKTEVHCAENSPAVRAVVLSGLGGNFSAGGDAQSIVDAIDGPTGDVALLMATFHALIRSIWQSPLPVIAAVSGVAYGGGFNLALSCDLVVCSASTRFCQVFLRRGLVPDLGGAFLLPRLVGLQRAKALMLFSPEIDAAQAYALGLVNEVLSDGTNVRGRAVELGTQLAGMSATAVALTKQMLNASAGDLDGSLDMEAMAQTVALGTAEAREGFARFI